MNNATLFASVIEKPQLRYVDEGSTALSSFLVSFEGSKGSEFIRVNAWRGMAETSLTLEKGSQVLLNGRLGISTYVQNDVKVQGVTLSASGISILGQAPVKLMPKKLEAKAEETPSAPPVPQTSEASDFDEIPF